MEPISETLRRHLPTLTSAEICEIIKFCDEELQDRIDEEVALADALEADVEEYCAGG